jgi:hypothetical protein
MPPQSLLEQLVQQQLVQLELNLSVRLHDEDEPA